MTTKSVLLLVGSLVLGLSFSGCNSTDNPGVQPAAAPAPGTPTPPAPTNPPHNDDPHGGSSAPKPDSGSSANDDAAKVAFLKTLAAGEKTLTLANTTITFKQGNKTAGTQANWTSLCLPTRAMTLSGEYPAVSFEMGSFTCEKEPSPPPYELSVLRMLMEKLDYQATFIPAGTVDPHQFRLTLQDVDDSTLDSMIHWKSQKSLNALTRDKELYLDFLGESEEDIGLGNETYFMEMSLKQSDNGIKFHLDYTSDASMNQTHTEISLDADVQ